MFYPPDVGDVVSAHQSQIEVLQRNIALALQDGLPSAPKFHLAESDQERRLGYREAFGLCRRFMDRNLVACALGHLLLSDKQAGRMAREVMLEICSWGAEGPCAVDGPWGDEIGLSCARVLPAVFDWTWGLYDDAERARIAELLRAYGNQMYRRLTELDFFSKPGSSHAGRLPGYLGETALALKGLADKELLTTWLQYALDVFASLFPHFGGRDGGWAEGVFYASSYTKWYLPFFLAVERHTGFSFLDRPFYRKLSQFFLHFAPPGWEVHPFGDGYWCLSGDPEWPGFLAQNPFGVYADRHGPELAREFSRQLLPKDHFELHLLDVFTRPVADRQKDSEGPVAQSRAFRDSGFVSMHTCIGSPDQDTAVLARASKYGTASHQHADQGSFAIISRGRGLITPSGYFGAAYGTRHHADWTRQTKAHNCILVDGKGQKTGSYLATGRIDFLRDNGDYAITRLNLSAAHDKLTTWTRTILLVRPGMVVVYDDVVADAAHTYSWLLHSLSKPEILDGRIVIDRTPARLALQLFTGTGRAAAPAHTHRFDPPVNEGVPEEHQVDMPDQHHLRWDTRPTERCRFAAVISLNGEAVTVEQDESTLSANCCDVRLEAALSTYVGPYLSLDGESLIH